MTALRVHVLFWLGVLSTCIAFEYAVRSHFLSPAVYAAPTEILARLPAFLFGDGHIRDLWVTAYRTVMAVIFGYPLGIMISIFIYSLGRAQSSGELMLDLVRSIPLTALVPVFIGVFGIGEWNKIAIGTTAATLAAAITALLGIRDADRRFSVVLHLYRPAYLPKFLLVLLPAAKSELFTAFRLAVSSALVLVIVAEMFIGTQDGIGKVINDKTYGDDRAGQFAAVVCSGLLGYLLNAGLGVIPKIIERLNVRRRSATTTPG